MSTNFQKQLDQLRKRKLFFIFLILVVVAVILWILIAIFASQEHIAIDKEMEKIRKPLEFDIDENILNKFSEKKFFSNSELINFPIYRLRRTEKMNYTEFRTTSEIERNLNVDLSFGGFEFEYQSTSQDNTRISDPVPDEISRTAE